MRFTVVPVVLALLSPLGIEALQSGSVAAERIFAAADITVGKTVCEIGAGDGDLTLAAARLVGPTGKVYTSELGERRVRTLEENVADSKLAHVVVVAGAETKTNFPEGVCDAVFMHNVYHHFSDPASMNASIAASMKPGGRLAVVDFTPPGEEAERPGDRGNDGKHGIRPETLARELKDAGFQPLASEDGSGRWFMVVVTNPDRR